MTGGDIFLTVVALAGFGVSAASWIGLIRAIRKGEVREVPRGSRLDTWLLLAGWVMTLSLIWAAYDDWRDPWHLHDAPRLSIHNTHGWALAVLSSSLVPLGLLVLFVGCYAKFKARKDSLDPARFWDDIPPASRAECEVLLEQLKDDTVWEKGNHAVAAYLLNIMLRNMNSDDAWDSDMPLWDALRPELMRRFPTPEQREAAAEAIQTEYIRLFEECP